MNGMHHGTLQSGLRTIFSAATSSRSSFRVFKHCPKYFARMASTLPSSPIFQAISKHNSNNSAIIHSSSDRTFCYGSLLHDVAASKDNLTRVANGSSLKGERIAFLAENGYDYVGEYLYHCISSSLLIQTQLLSYPYWHRMPLLFLWRIPFLPPSFDTFLKIAVLRYCYQQKNLRIKQMM